MNKLKSFFYDILLFSCLIWLPVSNVSADPIEGKQSIFDLLHQREIMQVSLVFPWQYLVENRRDSLDHVSIFSFVDADGRTQTLEAEISLRGRFRRMRCSEVPPLKVKFKKKHLAALGLTKHNDFKLVSYCKDDSEASKEALLKEYLAYKLYNEISEASFRVQLIEITYIDSQTGHSEKQLAFIIEDTAQLRDRLNAERPDQERYIYAADFTEKERQDVALFQYLISNTDWSFTIPKNIKYFAKDGKIIPVPYDFDFSGFVSAPYALLTDQYGQKSLRDRRWLGFPDDQHILEKPNKRFSEIKHKFHELIVNCQFLDTEAQRDLIGFTGTYFVATAGEHRPVSE